MTRDDIFLRATAAGFSPIEAPHPDMQMFIHGIRGISLIVTVEDHDDGRKWVHISIAKPPHIIGSPGWDDLVLARNAIVGPNAKAIQVLPPVEEHVNFHPKCFHIFHCLSEDPLPDFTRGKGIL